MSNTTVAVALTVAEAGVILKRLGTAWRGVECPLGIKQVGQGGGGGMQASLGRGECGGRTRAAPAGALRLVSLLLVMLLA